MRSFVIIGTQGLGSPYKKLEPWWEPEPRKEMQPPPLLLKAAGRGNALSDFSLPDALQQWSSASHVPDPARNQLTRSDKWTWSQEALGQRSSLFKKCCNTLEMKGTTASFPRDSDSKEPGNSSGAPLILQVRLQRGK